MLDLNSRDDGLVVTTKLSQFFIKTKGQGLIRDSLRSNFILFLDRRGEKNKESITTNSCL